MGSITPYISKTSISIADISEWPAAASKVKTWRLLFNIISSYCIFIADHNFINDTFYVHYSAGLLLKLSVPTAVLSLSNLLTTTFIIQTRGVWKREKGGFWFPFLFFFSFFSFSPSPLSLFFCYYVIFC
ncbi:MAG: hypothetical protein ACKERG_03025 [Candidatus Hodgkinia cicadicola]